MEHHLLEEDAEIHKAMALKLIGFLTGVEQKKSKFIMTHALLWSENSIPAICVILIGLTAVNAVIIHTVCSIL